MQSFNRTSFNDGESITEDIPLIIVVTENKYYSRSQDEVQARIARKRIARM